MSAGVARQRVEQCFRVALVQDPLANLQEAERWAHAIRDASVLQAPRRDGEQGGDMGHIMKPPKMNVNMQLNITGEKGTQAIYLSVLAIRYSFAVNMKNITK